MHLYEQIDNLCKENGTNITSMCKTTGVSRSALSDYKAGRIKTISRSNLQKIANFFKVDINFFTEEPVPYCRECGLQYLKDMPSEVKAHQQHHRNWEIAVDKFGFCWPSNVRESVKSECYEVLDNKKKSVDDKTEALRTILKCYFSRSLEGNDYDINHVDFKEYSAMILNQDSFRDRFSKEIWQPLVNEYGIKPGISSGTYYFPSGKPRDVQDERNNSKPFFKEKTETQTINTIAAHLDGEELGENEINDILKFIDFVKQKKN